MHAEIISVGTELTAGTKLDTNSQWLSLELAEIGIPVLAHMTIADELDEMVGALRTAAERSEIVLMTGGLGPTLDDLTRDALAKFAGVELILHEQSLEYIKSMFAKRNRPMPERNVMQAMFPLGSDPLPNPRGTAPGIWMTYRRADGTLSNIAAMPGVPSEMKQMFRQQVLPRLDGSGQVIRRARINLFGVGESQAEEALGDLTARGRDPDVGITVHEATITLRITAAASSIDECHQKIEKTREIVLNRMGTLVFGVEDEELEHALVRLLKLRRASLSTAESGTGGLLAHRLTGVPGFESCYMGGVVVPTNLAKRELVSVDPMLIRQYGPISQEVALACAKGCRQRFGTHFALAVTEWPNFDPDDPLAPFPASFVALAGPNHSKVEKVQHFGDPAIAKSRTAKVAMNMLRLYLIEG
ncbi:CinA family nicotinamide mononucleotide deamidase-related protein [Schlesneria sp. DSM 10557]|uniref:CinA family nicotinamide mononucleotide deamidase-related protein n=1 Tax=Schlesneria sp. DSM 10557 TaxID=3044399 RepID=UPI0035A074FC